MGPVYYVRFIRGFPMLGRADGDTVSAIGFFATMKDDQPNGIVMEIFKPGDMDYDRWTAPANMFEAGMERLVDKAITRLNQLFSRITSGASDVAQAAVNGVKYATRTDPKVKAGTNER